MALKGGTVGSIKALRKTLKSSGGSEFIKFIPADGGITVRFLSEPNEWLLWFKHWADGAPVGCIGNGCPKCADGDRAAKRYLAPAVDTSDGNQVIVIELPVSVVQILLRRYDKYSTLMDRDYELTRTGEGLENTKYDAVPEAPTRMNLKMYVVPDLNQVLEDNIPASDAEDDDSDDDEEEARPVRKAAKKSIGKAPAKKAAPKRRPTILDEDEDEEDEKASRRPVRKVAKKTAPARRSMRRS